MPKRPSLTYRQVTRILRDRGFRLDRQDGSHQQWVGLVRDQPRVVTMIADAKDYAPKTMKSMIRQPVLTEHEWYGGEG
jgi:predicted RNA binding protein YcfA (HicA-like mRNA interferase family)